MNTTTTTAGGWTALASLIVLAASHFGIVIDSNAILQVIAGIVSAVGIVHLILQHQKLQASVTASQVVK